MTIQRILVSEDGEHTVQYVDLGLPDHASEAAKEAVSRRKAKEGENQLAELQAISPDMVKAHNEMAVKNDDIKNPQVPTSTYERDESQSGLVRLLSLDDNQDGYVSAREIKAGLEEGKITSEEVLAAEQARGKPRTTVLNMVEPSGMVEPEPEPESKKEDDVVVTDWQCPKCGRYLKSRAALAAHFRGKHK
jgi:hypothetical protein